MGTWVSWVFRLLFAFLDFCLFSFVFGFTFLDRGGRFLFFFVSFLEGMWGSFLGCSCISCGFLEDIVV